MKSNVPTTLVFCIITGVTVYFAGIQINTACLTCFVLSTVASLAYWGGHSDGYEERKEIAKIEE